MDVAGGCGLNASRPFAPSDTTAEALLRNDQTDAAPSSATPLRSAARFAQDGRVVVEALGFTRMTAGVFIAVE